MFSYVWPIGLVILSNIIYHICAKSTPADVNPLASLTITYLVGAIASALLYLVTNKGGNLFQELSKINWTSFILGIVIIGLEAGYLYAYKAGWNVSTAAIVQSSFLAIGLFIVGLLLFKEEITTNKIIGIVICMIGLIFINK